MSETKKCDLIDMETLERVAPIIRNAAHPIRLRILDYLQQEGEPRTVTQIIEAAGAGQAVVSQQLRILKDQQVLSARREGNFMLYGIANHSVLMLLDCIRCHKSVD
jgi:ArsR family transcriptional regulator